MKSKKFIISFEKAVTTIKIKTSALYNSIRKSGTFEKAKERSKNALVKSKEELSLLFLRVRNSSFYKKTKEFLSDLQSRLKNLLYSVKEWFICILQKVKDSKFVISLSTNIKISILPFINEKGNKLRNYLVDLIKSAKTKIVLRPAIFVPIFIFTGIFLILLIVYQTLFAKYYWEGEEDKRFTVNPGQTLTEVAEELKEQDLIGNSFVFKLIAKVSGKEDNILARNYIFKNGMSNVELLTLLTDISINQSTRFTVIEGLTLKQIAANVERKFFLSSEKFLKESENDSLINILGLKDSVSNLEGFLFPDTYIVPINLTEKYLVEIMFDEFLRKVWKSEGIRARISEEDTNILEVVTLASIVQAETPLKEEKPRVSGVYQNRLKNRMRLEADPTIQYILPNGPKKRLLYNDLKIDSPYNTYLNFGLPPGPINNPGLEAIDAVLNPEKHNYLFFVADGYGGHKFSKTYAEHLQAVREYRSKRRNQNNHN
jgi:UPF0755 protein